MNNPFLASRPVKVNVSISNHLGAFAFIFLCLWLIMKNYNIFFVFRKKPPFLFIWLYSNENLIFKTWLIHLSIFHIFFIASMYNTFYSLRKVFIENCVYPLFNPQPPTLSLLLFSINLNTITQKFSKVSTWASSVFLIELRAVN